MADTRRERRGPTVWGAARLYTVRLVFRIMDGLCLVSTWVEEVVDHPATVHPVARMTVRPAPRKAPIYSRTCLHATAVEIFTVTCVDFSMLRNLRPWKTFHVIKV